MENKEYFKSDYPVTSEDDDKFQRYGFAKRIAETIKGRNNTEALVIGVLGAWGEGKTSVLNFIEAELIGEPKIECMRFNPWRYQNEDILLKNFLLLIAKTLGFNMGDVKERVGGFVKKYGSISKAVKIDLSPGTSVSLDFSELGKALTDVDIEAFKTKVSEKLSANADKLIVFIDDIDRLDKEEIHAIFRLVKLTADFKNTVYILSFDEDLVASAIDERYGNKAGRSGALFLEKIIQVPLHLPLVQPFALNQFCYGLMQNSFEANNVTLTEADNDRFGMQFTTNILPRLTNPRLAVRYNNAISFALPLLEGEANRVDLLLIEGIKIFYPPFYNFIKNNSGYFVEAFYNKFYLPGNADKRAKEAKDMLLTVMPELIQQERDLVHDLLMDMFPILKSSFTAGHYTSEPYYQQWYHEKRICSAQYFERYFSYTVYKGQLPDVEFEQFIANLEKLEVSQITELLSVLSTQISAGTLLQKLRFIEQTLPWEKAVKLIEAICIAPDWFINDKDTTMFKFTGAFDQVVIFIFQLFNREKARAEVFDFCKKMMLQLPSTPFALKLYTWLVKEEVPEYRVFKEAENKELVEIIVDKAVAEAGEISIFEKFPGDRYYLSIYWKEANQEKLYKYVEDSIGETQQEMLDFLKLFVQSVSHKGRPIPFLTNMSKNDYNFLFMITNTTSLYHKIHSLYTKEELENENPYWIENVGDTRDFSELNMIRQFIYRYEEQQRNP